MNKAKQSKTKKASTDGNAQKMERFGLQYPRSAGIDIGSMLMVVSYTDRQDMIHLREFDSFTSSLHELAGLLQKEGVEIVTMEATGSYWKSLYSVLENRGISVVLINPSHYRNVSAQKTDVKDAQWLHQLLAHGLLRNSHIAPELYRQLRCYLDERTTLQEEKSKALNRIQKHLTVMNIKFQHLISDIEGVTGMQLLRAIAAGENDPAVLLAPINLKLLKASPEELFKSLEGDYQEHYINILALNLKYYDLLKAQMTAYEFHIEVSLQKLLADKQQAAPVGIKKKTKVRKNQYHFNLSEYLHSIYGVDLTAVEGLDEIGLLSILSITGTDMNKWPTAGHFSSWLNLAPRPQISGGKVLHYEKRVTNNAATQAFRLAANSLWQSKGPLGQQYRKLAASKGSVKAIKAIARKIAVIFYNMVLKQQAYDPAKVQQDEAQQAARNLARLKRDASRLGFSLAQTA